MYTYRTLVKKENLYLPVIHMQIAKPLTPMEVESGDYEMCGADVLLDTGSTTTLIDERIARRLGLECYSKDEIAFTDGLGVANSYFCTLIFPGNEISGRRLVNGFIPQTEYYSCIIGMDVLRHGRFSVDGLTKEISLELSFTEEEA